MALHVIRLEDPIQAQQQPFAQLWGATQNLGPLALPRASLPTSSYIRPEFPIYGRFRVKVISAPQGPYGFTIQLLNDEDNLSLFQEQLQALLHQPFEYEPPIGAPCVLLSWDLRYYRGCITAAADENRFMVEHVDRGSSEMCNLTQLRQISEALLRVPTFTYRVSLEDAERMIYLKGLDKVFQGILTNAQVLVAEGIPGAPNRIALYIHDGRSVYDILAGVFGFGRTQMPTATCTPSPLPAQVLLGHSSQVNGKKYIKILKAVIINFFFLFKDP